MSSAEERRLALIRWMRTRITHHSWTVTGIVDISGIYNGHGRYDRCFDDLKVLAKRGVVTRLGGRPARWEVA
jgi:hypothetical protein